MEGPYQTLVLAPEAILETPVPFLGGKGDLPLPPALGEIVMRYALDPAALEPGERTVGRVLTARLAWVTLKRGRVFRLPTTEDYWAESGEE